MSDTVHTEGHTHRGTYTRGGDIHTGGEYTHEGKIHTRDTYMEETYTQYIERCIYCNVSHENLIKPLELTSVGIFSPQAQFIRAALLHLLHHLVGHCFYILTTRPHWVALLHLPQQAQFIFTTRPRWATILHLPHQAQLGSFYTSSSLTTRPCWAALLHLPHQAQLGNASRSSSPGPVSQRFYIFLTILR